MDEFGLVAFVDTWIEDQIFIYTLREDFLDENRKLTQLMISYPIEFTNVFLLKTDEDKLFYHSLLISNFSYKRLMNNEEFIYFY